MIQDRFKFRIFDKAAGLMSYDVALHSDRVIAKLCDGYIPYTEDRLKDIDLMACTGIKDKHGNLIYEGDLLAPLSEDDNKVIVEWDEKRGRFHLRIEWTDYAYWNGLYDEVVSGHDYYELDDFYMSEFEVIGNIWETKDEPVEV